MPVRLEHHWMLVEAPAILEVLGAQPWIPVPRAHAHLPGVCAWRGRALAVLDLPRMLGFRNEPLGSAPRTLILNTTSGRIAVPVHEARAVMSLEDEQLRPVHATALPFMSAEVDDGSAALPVLDIGAIVAALMPKHTHEQPSP